MWHQRNLYICQVASQTHRHNKISRVNGSFLVISKSGKVTSTYGDGYISYFITGWWSFHIWRKLVSVTYEYEVQYQIEFLHRICHPTWISALQSWPFNFLYVVKLDIQSQTWVFFNSHLVCPHIEHNYWSPRGVKEVFKLIVRGRDTIGHAVKDHLVVTLTPLLCQRDSVRVTLTLWLSATTHRPSHFEVECHWDLDHWTCTITEGPSIAVATVRTFFN